MPYIPYLGTDGRALDVDLDHASLEDIMSALGSSYNSNNEPSTLNSNSQSSLLKEPSVPSLGTIPPVQLHQHLPQQHNAVIMPRSLSNYSAVNATAIFTMHQQQTRQIIAIATSSLSLAAALIAVFWFFMMRRNFRRDLVLLLILGGAFKSLWFVVFSVYSLLHGAVTSESAFCQANGFLLQVGFEQCDAAVLFMSMHMYYQIFPTHRFGLSHDGLYRVRKWVYGAWILFPNLSAALAFVNPRSAFMNVGGFCSLPLRPFWYRIALFWVPRYLVWCYIVFVAVRIYWHVGREFRVFGQERDRSSSLGVPGNSSVDRMMKTEMDQRQGRQHSSFKKLSSVGVGQDDNVDCAPDDVSGIHVVRANAMPTTDSPKISLSNYSRRQSTPNWTLNATPTSEDTAIFAPPTISYPSSRRGSQQIGNGVTAEDFAPPAALNLSAHRGSITSLGSKKSSAAASFDIMSGLPSITEGALVLPKMDEARATTSEALKLRRRLIQRQLKLLFIYPCIYMLLWVIPLVVNIMNYTDYFAQHPVFTLGILNLLCVTIMTFGDVVIFCWRERPWRHIPGSDGTFTGSLMFWRYCFGTQWAQDRRMSRVPSYIPDEKEHENETSQAESGWISSLKKWSVSLKSPSPRSSDASTSKPARPKTHRRMHSGGSDRKMMEADRAHERLKLERQDYELNRRNLQEKRGSVVSQQPVAPPAAVQTERKEWFDQDGDLFRDVDLEDGESRPPT